ncbi:hypothetical protein [Pseudobacillus badius]|uniref:hypothetical protein n=1 Tax=Bacillus badius TaxID=1455 RepID=UPI0024A2E19F|nr:hypothetical protein [Bacillus badius]MED0667948.1 hypothetical protein [Bacillus badius]GLY11440.1 hypothetical protein Bbad01_26560 [Bacillus badius]
MKKNVWEAYQNYKRVNRKDISLSDIQAVHKSLLEQSIGITQDIVDTVDRNDYVKLSLLVIKRKQIQTAIEDIETIYGNDLFTSQSLKDHIIDELRSNAKSGKYVLQSIQSGISRLNHLIHSTTSKTLTVFSRTISTSDYLKFKVGRFIVSQTSSRLVKLADALKKNS